MRPHLDAKKFKLAMLMYRARIHRIQRWWRSIREYNNLRAHFVFLQLIARDKQLCVATAHKQTQPQMNARGRPRARSSSSSGSRPPRGCRCAGGPGPISA